MMNKIKKEFEDGMKLIWKKIDPTDLKPGDHIYAYKRYGSYSHHGIYVEDGYVIHFTRTESKEAILPYSRVEAKTVPACPKCRYQENTGRGVIRTCLDCFRRDHKTLHSIHYFMYGAPQLGFLLKNSGTCNTLSCTKSPKEVVEAAYELLKSNDFGKYDLTGNNCEHFATYCKTGVRASVQTAFYDACLMKYKELKNHSEVGKVVLFPLAIVFNLRILAFWQILYKIEMLSMSKVVECGFWFVSSSRSTMQYGRGVHANAIV